jgi:phosphoglycerate dehydrogenase-like enzyme
MRGVEISGRTLGIIGLGAIGKRVAEIGLALGMAVTAYDPYVDDGPPAVTMVELDELLATADFVTVHVPATAETEGLLDEGRLALMKPTAYLVNVSDASVVEQEPLVNALRDRRIAGAAFDVFESHPVSPQNPLLALDNVVLSPHLGGATVETIERHSEMIADDILSFLDGQKPKNLVNPEVLDSSG